MKNKLLLLLALLFAAHSASASPLIFKIAKDIDSPDKYVELFTLDTAKYKELRTHISCSTTNFNVLIKAVEGEDELRIFTAQSIGVRSELPLDSNWVIPIAPSKIRVFVWGKGTFKGFVWGN